VRTQLKSLPVKNDNRFVRLLWVLVVALGVSGDASLPAQAVPATQTAQSTSTKSRLQNRTFKSESLDRVMKYRVWVPAGYFSGARTDSDFLFLGLTRNPGYARFDLAASYAIGRGISLYARATNVSSPRSTPAAQIAIP